MNRWKSARFRVGGLAAVAAVALTVAACGSSSGSNSSAASSGSQASGSSGTAASSSNGYAGSSSSSGSNTSSSSSGSTLAISTAKGPDGVHLTGESGKALYLWVADSNGKSVCSGACAQAWPPVTVKSMPKASGGVVSSDLGTISRSNGTKQVTYKGHPLYYYIGDSHSGQVTGQGSNGFGAKWWLVAPKGTAITTG